MKKMIVKCPACANKHDYYLSKPWSPFCSERCRLIDLGAWASEEHRIKGEVRAENVPDSDNEQDKFIN